METPDKPYQLTFEERDGYLFARITAETINRDMAMQYLNELADKCVELKLERILLERQIPATMSNTDTYFVMGDLVRILGGRRFAVVNPHMSNEDSLGFSALVGANRGVRYRVFQNIADAEQWLLS
jgi:hypothetical protein